MDMSPQMQEAIKRAGYQAIGQGLFILLSAIAAGASLRTAVIAGALAALGALGFRGVYEGRKDAARAASGVVIPSDIQAPAMPANVVSIEAIRPHLGG